MQPPLWLYLHFRHLQLDALFAQQDNPSPLIIVDPQSNEVLQANAAATSCGISVGISLGTAAALSGELQVVPYKPEIEEQKLQQVAEHLYLATADICFFAPSGLLLRVHNMLHLYGGLSTYWQAIQQQLKPLHLKYDFATAHSPVAAHLLAINCYNCISDDQQKIRQRVGRTPLNSPFLAARSIAKLHSIGVQNHAQLQAIPLADLSKRFDIELVTYLGRLRGEIKQPLNFFHPPKAFNRYLELLYEINNTHTLQHPLTHLLNVLEDFLKQRDLITQSLCIRLYQREKPQLELIVGCGQGEYQAQKWLTLIALKLEQLRLAAPVYAIGLTTGKTQVQQPEKRDFFVGKQGALSRLQLTAMLQAKLGEQSVATPRLANDFRPEVANCNEANLASSEHTTPCQALRPTFLLAEAQPLREDVSLMQGPERLNSGWWDNNSVVRDYFIARNRQGQWYWVYRTPQQQWFVHGVFS